MSLNRILFYTIFATALSLFQFGCNGGGEDRETSNPGTEKPNIIIIYGDDIGYGDIGAYGAEKIQTPNIDSLAQNGIRFTNAYATAAMCTPSRYSLMTGQYAFRHPNSGILSAEDPMIIKPGSLTLPGMLREQGYRTSIVGKWHLGLGSEVRGVDWNGEIKPGPLEVGFDESFLLPVTNDRVPTVFVKGHRVYNLSEEDEPLQVRYPKEGSHEYQEGQAGDKKEFPQKVPQPLVGDLPSGHTNPEMLRYPADAQHSGTIVNGVSRIGYMAGGQSAWWDDEKIASTFVDRSEKFIQQHNKTPFFLYLSMHEAHVARMPDSSFVGSSKSSLRGDSVQELDWVVGRVMVALKETGLRENTMIIFTSDNGPVFFDGYEDGSLEDHNGHDPSGRFSGGKYTGYEGGTRIPMILSWPGRVERGTSDALISQVDLLASLGALTGVQIPDSLNMDSENILPALLGQSKKGREQLVEQSSDGLGIRQGKWKYIPPGKRSDFAYERHNRGNTPLNTPALTPKAYLFNLEDDPGETNNLVGENPKKTNELNKLLEKIERNTI